MNVHQRIAILIPAVSFFLPVNGLATALAQCTAGGAPDTRSGLSGNDSNDHPFVNQCLGASNTNVTITIEAMADLGCNAFDATHLPRSGSSCPAGCSGICCDTSATSKYVTVTANGNSLTPSVGGSSNMPTGGLFFQEWNTDCTTNSTACLEAGRSPCDPENPAPNKRVVTIPAATWNTWLGASGNTMTIRVTASSSVASAPLPERSLALYCENLGFNLCPFQSCSGLCGPDTFSRITVSYTPKQIFCNPSCTDTQCQFRDCQNGACVVTGNKAAGTPCGSSSNTECTNPDTCNGSGACLSNHAPGGTPCGDPTNSTCTNPDTCNGFGSCLANHEPSGTDCSDANVCNGIESCNGGGMCTPSFVADCNANLVEDSCDLTDPNIGDCNGNLIPDDCDVANCSGDPACEDCNVNAIPDFCDIMSRTGQDCDLNGVPDECEPGSPFEAMLVGASFSCDDNLPRTQKHVLRLTFSCDIQPPQAGEVEIRELQASGGFAPVDLSSQFTFSVENDRTIRMQENGSALANQTWYGILNIGLWIDAAPFEMNYFDLRGDANNDGFTDFGDLSFINANQTGSAADDNRSDINADGFVDNSDLSAAFVYNGSTVTAKPGGHACTIP